MGDGIFDLTAERLDREACAECGRQLGGELRVRRPDGQVVCQRMACQRCFGCDDPLTEDDVEYALDRARNPMYCVDCHRRDRFEGEE